jgi:quercetin dioxygenase-like cupin family protein
MGSSRNLNIRRVVTGHDPLGKACVQKDALVDNVIVMPSGHQGALIWAADGSSAHINSNIEEDFDPAYQKLKGIAPPAGGHLFRILQLEPGNAAFLHRTDTIDYAIVMKGKCIMELDDKEKVEMSAGDVMVQRGTWHGWEAIGEEPCQLAFILISAEAPEKHLHH